MKIKILSIAVVAIVGFSAAHLANGHNCLFGKPGKSMAKSKTAALKAKAEIALATDLKTGHDPKCKEEGHNH